MSHCDSPAEDITDPMAWEFPAPFLHRRLLEQGPGGAITQNLSTSHQKHHYICAPLSLFPNVAGSVESQLSTRLHCFDMALPLLVFV